MKALPLIIAALALFVIIVAVTRPRLIRKMRKEITPNSYTTPATNGTNQGVNNSTTTQPTEGTQMTQKSSGTLTLVVTQPQDGADLSSVTVTVSGKTAPKAEVSVNDKSLTADASGNFTTTITLDEGDDEINVTANDANGNFAEKTISVNLP